MVQAGDTAARRWPILFDTVSGQVTGPDRGTLQFSLGSNPDIDLRVRLVLLLGDTPGQCGEEVGLESRCAEIPGCVLAFPTLVRNGDWLTPEGGGCPLDVADLARTLPVDCRPRCGTYDQATATCNPELVPGAQDRSCCTVSPECMPVVGGAAVCRSSLGVCGGGLPLCTARGWACLDPETREAVETTCDQLDNDCDGEVDEGLTGCCRPGALRSCGVSLGECLPGVQRCEGEGAATVWSACGGEAYRGPQPEVCNGLDDDCDGELDEDLPSCSCIPGETRPCSRDEGECRAGEVRCDDQGTWGPCSGIEPAASDRCDGRDEDCDGTTDEEPPDCQHPHGISECRAGRCERVGCQDGWHDLDGRDDNGCEYECDQTGEHDPPDAAYRDDNCDGIDGEVARAVWVAASVGVDRDGCGTADAPCKTVQRGIDVAAAATPPAPVHVATGSYAETLTLRAGVDVYGDYAVVRQIGRASCRERV